MRVHRRDGRQRPFSPDRADVGQLRLLHERFSTVLIPEAVYQEIIVQGAGRTSAEAVQAAAWIE